MNRHIIFLFVPTPFYIWAIYSLWKNGLEYTSVTLMIVSFMFASVILILVWALIIKDKRIEQWANDNNFEFIKKDKLNVSPLEGYANDNFYQIINGKKDDIKFTFSNFEAHSTRSGNLRNRNFLNGSLVTTRIKLPKFEIRGKIRARMNLIFQNEIDVNDYPDIKKKCVVTGEMSTLKLFTPEFIEWFNNYYYMDIKSDGENLIWYTTPKSATDLDQHLANFGKLVKILENQKS